MIEKLQISDFKTEYVSPDYPPFLKWCEGDIKICLEPCYSGFCVGIYDDNDWILAEKKCTNAPELSREEALKVAVVLANELLKDWKSKNIIE